MYLKRLEMIGFKSFPEKIKLEFNKGITAVVGPNGSGKSNVSDAVRWVLGEQSAKSLRGAKMEDIIFAGTANRKPLGFAEVSLVLDNTDKVMNIDFTEVTVTRRVYRSGESEYKLNGITCRLKDIHELFMDTGIGKEGYSIVGQGRIEEILSSKGEERRLIFEEAAGIIKYKSRRHEALNKLEKEKQNLIRLNDIIEEIENQIGPLEIQAETAKEYLALSENLKLVQVNIFLNQVNSIADRTAKIDADLANLSVQIKDYQKKKNDADEGISRIKDDILDKDRQAERLNNDINDLRSETDQTKNEIRLKQEQKQHILSDIEFYSNELENKKVYIEQAGNILKTHEGNIESISNDLSIKTADLNEILAEFDDFQEKTSDSEAKIERYNAEIFEQMQALNEVKNSYNHVEAMYNQLEERKETLDDEIYSAEGAIVLKEQLLKDSDEKLRTIAFNISAVTAEMDKLTKEKEQLKSQEEENIQRLGKVQKEKNEVSSRLKLLKELESSFEGYYKSVKNLLQYKKGNPEKLKGIIGPVGELISVDKKYETAIEIALGQYIQNIVTANENDAKAGIEILKTYKWGRATFLPATSIKERPIGGAKSNILKEQGVLGIADELIGYDPAYKNIISNILGRTIIADYLDNAVKLARKYSYQYKIVTLDGDLLNAGGAMTGGSMPQKSANIFGRSREIKELAQKNETLSDQEIKLRETHVSIGRQLNTIKVLEEENRQKLHSFEMDQVSDKQRNELLQAELEGLRVKIADSKKENEMLMKQIVDANKELHKMEEEEVKAESLILGLREDLEKFHASMAGYRTEKDKKAGQITDIKVEISSLKEKLNAEQANRNRIIREIADSDNLIDQHKESIELKRQETVLKDQEIEKLNALVAELLEKYEILQKEAENIVAEKALKNQELITREEQSKELFVEISNLSNEQSRLEVTKENIDNEVRRLYDQMWDEYEITYQQAVQYPVLEKPLSVLQNEERLVKSKIRSLGNVNVNAIEEYKALKERYEFLSTQLEDIKSAEEKLKEVIMQLTELMEEQFKTQFKVISDNFSKVFVEMFGGGKAYLKLSDAENILESGIDIVAQPPGKVLQNMTLLSGGERALTATALLFAILKMKPSPFCILDEIEAALDDANVARYANYLRNFALDTQFIIITHRKGTMEAADVLYGITMQEQGVSKLVSVKFDDENITA